MKALSLFSGIGGIDLACEWAGIETVAFCEREPFPQKVLRKHWPNVPIYDDVCTLTKERLEADGIRTIDIIHGGYPCQPFSHAGKREGTEDDRHLWPEVFRLIQEFNPRWFVGENVAGHITLGLDVVLADLESIAYTWETFVIPASSIGSPQRRNRVFIVAYPKSIDQRGLSIRKGEKFTGSSVSDKNVANAKSERRRETREHSERSPEWTAGSGEILANSDSESGLQTNQTISTIGSKRNTRDYARRCGGDNESGIDWRTTESGMGGNSNGIPARLDGDHWPAAWGQEQKEWEPPRVATGVKNRNGRLKALGNAVNPYQIYPIIAAIKQIDDMIRAG